MRTRTKVLIAFGIYVGVFIILVAAIPSEGKNEAFKPQDEFKLDPWIEIKLGSLDLSITRAVFYLAIASTLTIAAMTYIANRMQTKPNRVQTAVEAAYDLTRNNIAGGNLEPAQAARWFAFVATLFFFIWFSNMIGYLPLPTNTHEKVNILGLELPAFAIYAATANISVPLVLTLMVWINYHIQGIRAKGPIRYFKSWLPAGLEDMPAFARGAIFVIEVISHFVRLISLSVRLFANLLAGHLLILFMGGGLAVLLGLAALGWLTLPIAAAFFLFEVVLIATLQAFIFATLTSIYLGGATAEHH